MVSLVNEKNVVKMATIRLLWYFAKLRCACERGLATYFVVWLFHVDYVE